MASYRGRGVPPRGPWKLSGMPSQRAWPSPRQSWHCFSDFKGGPRVALLGWEKEATQPGRPGLILLCSCQMGLVKEFLQMGLGSASLLCLTATLNLTLVLTPGFLTFLFSGIIEMAQLFAQNPSLGTWENRKDKEESGGPGLEAVELGTGSLELEWGV